MKKTLLLSMLCVLLTLPAMAQPGYRYGRGYEPRVQTVSRHGNEFIGWHRYYFGLRVGMNASHVNSGSPVLDGSGVKTGLNIGVAAGNSPIAPPCSSRRDSTTARRVARADRAWTNSPTT